MKLSDLLVAVGLGVTACSDPRCPQDLIQVGMICRRCPEGMVARGNECIPSESEAGTDEDAAMGTRETDDADGPEVDAGELATGRANADIADASVEPPRTDSGEALCFVDRDKDGVGAGMPVDCDSSSLVTSLGFSLSNQGNDCDDNNAHRSPSLSDLCGDKIDNDCDDKPDDEANNACNGPCTTQLAHQPGEVCTNGLEGACRRSGTYECEGASVRCNAPMISAGRETCGDQIDNDCDGAVDEIDAIDATTWYRDCDGDGYAPTASGAVPSCTKPAAREGCTWTSKVPQPSSHSDWDCNDTNTAYRPGASYGLPPDGLTGFDLDCDGQQTTDSSFVPNPRACVSAIVDYLNRPEPRGIAPSVALDNPGCYVWRDGNGRYRGSPATACPDQPMLVSIDPWNDAYLLRPNPPIWPCR